MFKKAVFPSTDDPIYLSLIKVGAMKYNPFQWRHLSFRMRNGGFLLNSKRQFIGLYRILQGGFLGNEQLNAVILNAASIFGTTRFFLTNIVVVTDFFARGNFTAFPRAGCPGFESAQLFLATCADAFVRPARAKQVGIASSLASEEAEMAAVTAIVNAAVMLHFPQVIALKD